MTTSDLATVAQFTAQYWNNSTMTVTGNASGEQAVKDFVTARGDIAHRGGDAGYVTIVKLRDDYKPRIMRTALDTDNYLSQHLRDIFPGGQRPWNRRTT